MITFTVHGNPQGLKRHRTTKSGHRYDPSSGDKADFLAMAMQSRPETPLNEPVRLVVKAYFARPKRHYFTGKRSNILRDTAEMYHIGMPDADNILKFVGDSLNHIFWKDDKVIASASILKQYTETTPRIVVEISTLTTGESQWQHS